MIFKNNDKQKAWMFGIKHNSDNYGKAIYDSAKEIAEKLEGLIIQTGDSHIGIKDYQEKVIDEIAEKYGATYMQILAALNILYDVWVYGDVLQFYT